MRLRPDAYPLYGPEEIRPRMEELIITILEEPYPRNLAIRVLDSTTRTHNLSLKASLSCKYSNSKPVNLIHAKLEPRAVTE
jgi:hypothetical protein